MGLETTCRVRSGTTTHEARVLLETDEVIVRGRARQRIPLTAITRVATANGELSVEHAAGTLVLALGADAEKWAERIRSPRTLVDKLGVCAGQTISLSGLGDEEFLEQLTRAGARVSAGRLLKNSDLVFLGATKAGDLTRIAAAAKAIKPNGAIWVVHPKGKGALRDTEVFAAAKRLGLVSTKVARFSATQTAEKLVIPVARR